MPLDLTIHPFVSCKERFITIEVKLTLLKQGTEACNICYCAHYLFFVKSNARGLGSTT